MVDPFPGEFSACEFGFRNDLHGKTQGKMLDSDFTESACL